MISTTMMSSLSSAGTALNASPEKAQHAQELSLRTFLTSLATFATVFAIEFCIFVFLKNRLKQI